VAASTCWLLERDGVEDCDNDHKPQSVITSARKKNDSHSQKGYPALQSSATTSSVSADKFKCRVSVQGSDIFAGFRALIDAGMMGPGAGTPASSTMLPNHVRDAPIFGAGGMIRVENGAIVDNQSGEFEQR